MRFPLVFLFACTGATQGEVQPSSEPVATTPPASPPPAPPTGSATPDATGMGWTGVLDEEAFKALHTLTTDAAPALAGATTQLPGGSEAYLSLPSGTGPFPAVVVIHEWWGLNDHIRHWADRLAQDGYAALAVDLYGGKVATTPDEAMKLMGAVDEAKAIEVLRGAHAFLETDPRVKATVTASLGWCFGGGWSLQLGLAEPNLDAVVMYYGRLVQDPERLKALGSRPLLGIFGKKDEGIPPAEVAEFDAALTTVGVPHQILSYDAPHAFANPSAGRYDPVAAAEAWKNVRVFLQEHLKKVDPSSPR